MSHEEEAAAEVEGGGMEGDGVDDLPAPLQPATAAQKHWLTRRAELIRGRVTSMADAKRLVADEGWSDAGVTACDEGGGDGVGAAVPEGRCRRSGGSQGVGIAVFPGSFNPPSVGHVKIAEAVLSLPGVDAIWFDLTIHRDKKRCVLS
jgi:hypothetical protein